MDYHGLSREACLHQLQTTRAGLPQTEGEKRRKQYGANQLPEPKQAGLARRFLCQFRDFMTLVLLAAAGVSFVVSYLQGAPDYVDTGIILAIVIINAIAGMVQESQAEKAIASLKKLSAPKATVLREGVPTELPAHQLVPGDVVLLSAGDLVPADLRLLEAQGLRVEEASLTGESLPIEKDAAAICAEKTPLGDRRNMLYLGSSVTEGSGLALVTATGSETQMGKIAQLLRQSESPQTPLQKRLDQTGKILSLGAVAVCLLIFVLGLLQSIPPLEMLLVSISLAVAAIPEGLSAVVTMVLAMGVRRMAQKRAIVRQLHRVETLGSVSVICSDKTGTLTQNQMEVTRLVTPDGIVPEQSRAGQQLLELAACCTEGSREKGKAYGSPTEMAILRACRTEKSVLLQKRPQVHVVGFTSARKRMTTVHRLEAGRYQVIVKGAPDLLLERCSYVQRQGREQVLSPLERQRLLRQNNALGEEALRVLAVAVKTMDHLVTQPEGLEKNLTFCGFLCLMDPPRPEAAEAVALCKSAGIRTVMVTGDHLATAKAVAKEVGIFNVGDLALTGAQLDRMSQKQLEEEADRYTVYARVSPEHKVRIVQAFQRRGAVVAMTGDGVNDAPALQAADLGCAMGRSGTEVAKSAADLILTDDNFATIVDAVGEGRCIYANIRKTIHFLLSCNVGEILTVLASFLLHLPTPLLAIQLLWVNLMTDSLPALALGVDPMERDQMQSPPNARNSGSFAKQMWYSMLVEGGMIGSLAVLAFTMGRVWFDSNPADPIIGRTMAFAVLSLSQLAHAFNMRSSGSVLRAGLFRNRSLVASVLLCLGLQIAVIELPFLTELFHTQPLTGVQWLLVAGLSVMPLFFVELEKQFCHKNRQNLRFAKKEHKKKKKIMQNQ